MKKFTYIQPVDLEVLPPILNINKRSNIDLLLIEKDTKKIKIDNNF
jgi:hypothetical protein